MGSYPSYSPSLPPQHPTLLGPMTSSLEVGNPPLRRLGPAISCMTFLHCYADCSARVREGKGGEGRPGGYRKVTDMALGSYRMTIVAPGLPRKIATWHDQVRSRTSTIMWDKQVSRRFAFPYGIGLSA